MQSPDLARAEIALRTVDPSRRSAVALDAIVASKREFSRGNRRPPALTAREALAALEFEALVVCTAIAGVFSGNELTEEDMERLAIAYDRIHRITTEVVR